MDLIEFIKENISEDYSFKITKELSFNFEKSKDNVILKVQQGTQYRSAVVYPIYITVTTENVSNAVDIWTEFVKNVSDRDFLEGKYNYYVQLQTPAVSQIFDEIKNNYYSTITIFGTIVEINNVLDIKKVEIDNVEVLQNEWTLNLANSPESEQPSDGKNLNTSVIQSSVLTFNVTITLIDYGDLTDKLYSMRTNLIDPDTTFNVKKTWTNGVVEENDYRLITQTIQKSRGGIPILTLHFSL